MKGHFLVAAVTGAAAGALSFIIGKKKKQKDANVSAQPSDGEVFPSEESIQAYVDKILEETSEYDPPLEAYEMDNEIISDDTRMAQRLLLTACFTTVICMFPKEEQNLASVSEILTTSVYVYDNMENLTPLDYMMEAAETWIKGDIEEIPKIISGDDLEGKIREDWKSSLRDITPSPVEKRFLGFAVSQYKSFKDLVTNDNVNDVVRSAIFRVRRYGLENFSIDL